MLYMFTLFKVAAKLHYFSTNMLLIPIPSRLIRGHFKNFKLKNQLNEELIFKR